MWLGDDREKRKRTRHCISSYAHTPQTAHWPLAWRPWTLAYAPLMVGLDSDMDWHSPDNGARLGMQNMHLVRRVGAWLGDKVWWWCGCAVGIWISMVVVYERGYGRNIHSQQIFLHFVTLLSHSCHTDIISDLAVPSLAHHGASPLYTHV